MELKFNVKEQEFLAQQVCQTIGQEETAEAIVPDSYPDVERLLTSHGVVTVRDHGYQNGNWVVNGAIHAWVLYSPQDYDTPKTLQYYIPFTVKCPCPDGESSQGVVDCRIGSLDAQMINSRKVMVRVNTVTDYLIYATTTQEQHSYCEEAPGQLETKQASYPLVQPMAVGAKSFTIAETVELSGGIPAMERICQYHCRLESVEEKLVGTKGVFKGLLHGWMLYETQEETMNTWVFQVPFSQYVELNQECDDMEMELQFLLSSLEMEPKEQGIALTAEVLAQCTVMGNCTLDTIEDAYSTTHQFVPQWEMAQPTSRVDSQHFNQVARSLKSCPAKAILATQAYVGAPTVSRRESISEVAVPINVHVLYEDERGEYQSESLKMDALFETEMANPCHCTMRPSLSGDPFAITAGDGIEVRCAISLDLETWVSQSIPMLAGGELGAVLEKNQYPSLILRHVEPEDSLWSVAKTCRTTMGDIATANNLGSLDEALTGMILIPVK